MRDQLPKIFFLLLFLFAAPGLCLGTSWLVDKFIEGTTKFLRRYRQVV